MTTMSHRGYEVVIEYDEEAEMLHGEVVNLRDTIALSGAIGARDVEGPCRQRRGSNSRTFRLTKLPYGASTTRSCHRASIERGIVPECQNSGPGRR